LTVLEWPAGNPAWSVLPAVRGGAVPTLALADRIVSAPLRLPAKPAAPGKPADPVQFCVADAGGRVSLIELQANGDLKPKKSWDVGGMVTTGPFIADAANLRIGAVVDKSRLVWIDPASDVVLWSYATADDDPIVGTPRVADGMVVVADQSGLYVGLDPKTGEKVGSGYRLRGSVAPVAGAVTFSKDRLLAPLSDGTVMLLSGRRLVDVKKK
jgi:outer membrane protein assembly factor BamB